MGFLPDIKTIIEAGINPKTGLPLKLYSPDYSLRDGISTLMHIIDRQDAINRFVWYNLPDGLTGTLIERILYYRGAGMLFYTKEDDKCIASTEKSTNMDGIKPLRRFYLTGRRKATSG